MDPTKATILRRSVKSTFAICSGRFLRSIRFTLTDDWFQNTKVLGEGETVGLTLLYLASSAEMLGDKETLGLHQHST